MRSKLAEVSLKTLGAFVVPIFWMLPVLRLNGRAHLRGALQPANLVTDLNGAVFMADVLRHMDWPWSTAQMISFPTGQSIWRWQAITQLIQWLSLWVMTRVFEPTFAVNFLVLLGWGLTGIAVYLLARELEAPAPIAALAAAMAQLLPAMPKMASNYTSYVFVCVPLLVILAALKMGREPTRRRLMTMAAWLLVAALFDPYWFFFSLCAVVIVCGFCFRGSIGRWYAASARAFDKLTLALLIGGPFLLILAVLVADRLSAATSSSRPLEIAPAGLIRAGLHSPLDWFRAGDEGLGIVIALLTICSIVIVIRSHPSRSVVSGVVLLGFFVLLSIDTGIGLAGFRVGALAEYLRFVLPGVRFFQRAALIAGALACIFAAMAWSSIWYRLRGTSARVAVSSVLVALVVVDLDPLGHRAVSREAERYDAFRSVLAETESPALLALPFSLKGRDWLELSFLDVPRMNPLYSVEPLRPINLAASRGPDEFAALLHSRRVTHVLSVLGQDRYPLAYELEPPRFVPRGRLVIGGYEDSDVLLELYEVHVQPGDSFCATCAAGNELDLVTDATLTGDAYPLEQAATEAPDWWWMHGPSAELEVELRDLPRVHTTVWFDVRNVLCGTSREVTVSHAGNEQIIQLEGQGTMTVAVPIAPDKASESIDIRVQGPSCTIDTDNRPFQLQVLFPTSIEPP